MKGALIAATVAALVTGIVAARSTTTSQSGLQGVWRVTEVSTAGAQPSATKQAQPGMYLFSGRHYSIVRVSSTTPRPAFRQADVERATADQLRAVWNPFVANAGTYEVAAGTVTMRPMVAKNPDVMSAGSFVVRSFKLDGSTLSITDVRNQDGPITNPTTVRLTRVE